MQMVAGALREDRAFLRVDELTLATRLWAIAVKYWSFGRRAAGLPAPSAFKFRGRRYHCDSFLDAAFLMVHLAEMRQSLRDLGLLGHGGLVAVDVGAHFGETILAWDTLLHKPVIHAFEPNPEAISVLRENVRGIPVRLYEMGLSDHDGREVFDLSHRFSGWHTFAFGDQRPTRSVTVQAARGDDVLDLDRIDILKIDVEGYEAQVLRGLSRTLPRCHYLMVELSLDRRRAYPFQEIARVLGEQPFDLVRTGTVWGDPARPTAIDLWFENLQWSARVPEHG